LHPHVEVGCHGARSSPSYRPPCPPDYDQVPCHSYSVGRMMCDDDPASLSISERPFLRAVSASPREINAVTNPADDPVLMIG
jgi:hypothetical protein